MVEDDFFLAVMILDDLKEHGASVVGPMASPSATLQALEGLNTPDRRSGVPRVNEPHT